AKAEETVEVYLFQENINTVNEIVQVYENQKEEFELLKNNHNHLTDIVENIQEIMNAELSRPMVLACEKLGDTITKIGDIARRGRQINAEALQDIQHQFSNYLQTTPLEPETQSLLLSIHNYYIERALSNTNDTFPSTYREGFIEFANELSQSQTEMQTTLKQMERHLQSMELQTARAGLTLLSETEEKKQAVLNAPKESITMEQLKEKLDEKKKVLDHAIQSGDFSRAK